MVGQDPQWPNSNDDPRREWNIHDIEIYELQRQVQELTKRLARQEQFSSEQEDNNNCEEYNPFMIKTTSSSLIT